MLQESRDVKSDPASFLTKTYRSVSGTDQTLLDATGLPISLVFWAGPGDEGTILKAASAYEAVTKHRRPPRAFGRSGVNRRSSGNVFAEIRFTNPERVQGFAWTGNRPIMNPERSSDRGEWRRK